jgi:hypothetical protein
MSDFTIMILMVPLGLRVGHTASMASIVSPLSCVTNAGYDFLGAGYLGRMFASWSVVRGVSWDDIWASMLGLRRRVVPRHITTAPRLWLVGDMETPSAGKQYIGPTSTQKHSSCSATRRYSMSTSLVSFVLQLMIVLVLLQLSRLSEPQLL